MSCGQIVARAIAYALVGVLVGAAIGGVRAWLEPHVDPGPFHYDAQRMNRIIDVALGVALGGFVGLCTFLATRLVHRLRR